MPAQLASVTRAEKTNGGYVLGSTLTDATTHAASITTTGATDWANVSDVDGGTLTVTNGATNVVTFTIEGSVDGVTFPAGDIGHRASGGGAFVTTAITTTAATTAFYFLSDVDRLNFIRVNVSAANANGTTFAFEGKTEGRK